jgi:hypothetical protein
MDDNLIRKLNVAVTMHANKLKLDKNERLIYLVEESQCMNPNAKMVLCRLENIINHFEHNDMNRFVIKQIQNYDIDTQAVFGMICNSGKTIYSHICNL